MGDKLSPIFIFPIFAMMKEEIYKISFKKELKHSRKNSNNC